MPSSPCLGLDWVPAHHSPPAITYFGPDPCWTPEREGRVDHFNPRPGAYEAQDPGTCDVCGGIDDPSPDPLHADLEEFVHVCQGCGRTPQERKVQRRHAPIRLPNLDVLRAYGQLGGPAPDLDGGGLKGGKGSRPKGRGRKAS